MAKKADDSVLLEEIRDNFDYCVDYWREIREEARIDMRYISGDPWDPKERKAREDLGRPCLVLDELNQYVNQLINDVRQNKRAIRVIPTGSGANDQTAELRGNIIRQIEYKSNAQDAYVTAFENAAQRSYGYFGFSTRYTSDNSFNQELKVRRFPNPDAVYLDPDAKERDFSDGSYAFVLDDMPWEKYKRKYPKAETRDFSGERTQLAPRWISEKSVQIAEYWKVVKKSTRMGLFVDGSTGRLPDPLGRQAIRERDAESREIKQYITNGLEILDSTDWLGQWIPIVPVFGKELYVDAGGGAKRVLFSVIRLARDPFMLYCYLRSQEQEEFGMTPRAPYMGYEGQFESHESDWQDANKSPKAYLEVKPVLDATGQNVLPLPQRRQFEPNIQSYEIGADAIKRAIQSAMGRYNTSVGRADTKASSGVAIKALDTQSDQGSFHFIDNFNRAIEHGGRILNDLLDKVYDTQRQVTTRKADGSFGLVMLGSQQPGQAPITIEGDHDVTIAVGPSAESERDLANNFMDTLATATPQLFVRIADLAVKSKNLGPMGDEIAQRLTPPDIAGKQGIPSQAQPIISQLQQQLQAMNAYAKQQEAKVSQLEGERQGTILKLQSQERIAALNAQVQLLLAESKIHGEALVTRLEAEFKAINNRLALLHEAEPIETETSASQTQ